MEPCCVPIILVSSNEKELCSFNPIDFLYILKLENSLVKGAFFLHVTSEEVEAMLIGIK